MRLGVTLPTFSEDASRLLDFAEQAEATRVHGVFSFDHLWPLRHPERPSLSLFPVLAAVAARTSSLCVGSLVARVGALPDEVLAASFESLKAIAGDRVVAGLGIGDAASDPEALRNGMALAGRRDRIEGLAQMIARLRRAEIDCWVGSKDPVLHEVAKETGAAINLWSTPPERVSETVELVGAEVSVTWAGPLPRDAVAASRKLQALRGAGCSWVVWGWPSSLETVAQAAALAGIELSTQDRAVNTGC